MNAKHTAQPSTARRTELYNRMIAMQKELSGGPSFADALSLEKEYQRLKDEFDLYYDDEEFDETSM